MQTDATGPTIDKMKAVLDPWYEALSNPARAQERVLAQLLAMYSQTDYGRKHHSEQVGSYADYQKAFPVSTFEDFKPYLDQVMAGNIHALLSEEPVAFAYTKGTTGKPKLVPYTPTHINQHLQYSQRSLYNFSFTHHDFEWMSGYRLNLVPSVNLGEIKIGGKALVYGFSLAVLMKLIKGLEDNAGIRVVPSHEEMDALPAAPSKLNWETRYELGFQKAREKNVTIFSTMPNIALGFARYIQRNHHILPKDLWQIKFMGMGGYPGIQTNYAPTLHSYYGKSTEMLEGYIATEGSYGIKVDGKKAWCPFYDLMFFEVLTIGGIKPLHEMIPGEIGSLIVSTPEFPRYRNEDLILAFEPPYFRCIGRENTRIHPYNFGKLTGKSYVKFGQPIDLAAWR